MERMEGGGREVLGGSLCRYDQLEYSRIVKIINMWLAREKKRKRDSFFEESPVPAIVFRAKGEEPRGEKGERVFTACVPSSAQEN